MTDGVKKPRASRPRKKAKAIPAAPEAESAAMTVVVAEGEPAVIVAAAPDAETPAAEIPTAPESGAAAAPFAGTHGYAPATYGQRQTEDVSHIAATLESKRDRLRKAHIGEIEAEGPSSPLPFQDTHGYSPATYRRPEYLDYLDKATTAIKTVRLYVYAFMTAFVILAFYGFFLIYQLTNDVHRAVDQTIVMAEQMQLMTREMTDMRASMKTMDATMTEMNGAVGTMNNSVARMDRSLVQMGNTMTLMQHSARNLDQSIGPVMGTMNRFMPFGWGGNSYPGAPPYAPPMR